VSLLLAPHYVPAADNGAIVLTDGSAIGSTYAQWTISFDGFTYVRNTAGAAVQDSAWINPQIGMGLYEVRATDAGGTNVPPGTLNVWLDMGNAWTWGWANNRGAEKSGELLIEVRRKVDLVVVGTAHISIVSGGLL